MVSAVTLITLTGAAPVAAQTDVPVPGVDLTLTDLTGVLGPGSVQVPEDPNGLPPAPDALELRVLVTNDGEAELTASQLVVEVHPAVRSRGALAAALRVAAELDEGVLVFIACDRGDRYLSSDLFA